MRNKSCQRNRVEIARVMVAARSAEVLGNGHTVVHSQRNAHGAIRKEMECVSAVMVREKFKVLMIS